MGTQCNGRCRGRHGRARAALMALVFAVATLSLFYAAKPSLGTNLRRQLTAEYAAPRVLWSVLCEGYSLDVNVLSSPQAELPLLVQV